MTDRLLLADVMPWLLFNNTLRVHHRPQHERTLGILFHLDGYTDFLLHGRYYA